MPAGVATSALAPVRLPMSARASGGGDRNRTFLSVSFRLPDDLPHLLFADVLINQCNSGTEFDRVSRQLGNVDDVGARQLVLKLGDAGLVLFLHLFCCVVFGVLRKVTIVCPRSASCRMIRGRSSRSRCRSSFSSFAWPSAVIGIFSIGSSHSAIANFR